MTRRLAHIVFGSAVAICVFSGAASVVTWRPVTGAAAPGVQDQEPVVLVGAGDIANCDVNGGSAPLRPEHCSINSGDGVHSRRSRVSVRND